MEVVIIKEVFKTVAFSVGLSTFCVFACWDEMPRWAYVMMTCLLAAIFSCRQK